MRVTSIKPALGRSGWVSLGDFSTEVRLLLGMLSGPDSAAIGGHYRQQEGAVVVPSWMPLHSTQLGLEDVCLPLYVMGLSAYGLEKWWCLTQVLKNNNNVRNLYCL